VTFQPKALDMVHSRTQGIPRLINLISDRSLLAAFSSRTNRVTEEMVHQAAGSLELVEGESLEIRLVPPPGVGHGNGGRRVGVARGRGRWSRARHARHPETPT
jgi:hypothetical protein